MKSITAVKLGDRFQHWHQVTCREFSVTEHRRMSDRQFRATVSIQEFGALALSDISSSTPPDDLIRVTRGPAEIRKDPRDDFLLRLMLSGEAWLSQDGREARIRPGDLVLQDQAQPFVLQFGHRAHALQVTIPRPLLTSRVLTARRLTARRIASGSKFGALAGMLVRQLFRLEDAADAEVERRLGGSALDLVATALEAELEASIIGPGGQRRFEQVKRYILANLHDSELNLETIARAQNISPRTLNRLFVGEGTTPMRWLWQRRLAASFRALKEGEVAQVTDAALSFGFSDVSHFCRAFKAEFGHSPGAFRPRKYLSR